MASQQFEATVETEGPGVFVEVPNAVVAALGAGRRPPVLVEVNGHRYRSTPAVYGGRSYLPLRREVREAAGIEVGQTLRIRLELDEQRQADKIARRPVERHVEIIRPGPKDS